MSISKLVTRALSLNQRGLLNLQMKVNSQAIQDLASLYIKNIENANIKSPKQLKIAKKMLSKRLRAECEKSQKFDNLVFQELKKKVLSCIDEKLSKQRDRSRRKLKTSRRRTIQSSSESDQDSVKAEEQSQTQQTQQKSRSLSSSNQTGSQSTGKRKKRKYATYDQQFKQEVCLYTNEYGPEEAAKKFKLSIRKVMNWYQAHQMNLLGRGRKALDPIMEFNLCIWILRKIWNQVPLTQKIIRQKAATLKTLNKPFNGSKGWLQKFFLRHVQLKSCFDTRGKPQLRSECARYHRCAFARLQKDSENLLRAGENVHKIVQGDLAQIIYFKQDHPILKFKEDKHLDKFTIDPRPFYNYDDLKNIVVPKIEQKNEEEDDDHNENQTGLCKVYEQSQEEDSSDEQEQIKEDQISSDQYSDESISYQEDSSQNQGMLKKEEESQQEYDLYEEQDEDESEEPKAKYRVKKQEAVKNQENAQ